MKTVAIKYIGDNGDIVEITPSNFIPFDFSDLFPKNDLFNLEAEIKAGDAKINEEVVDKDSTVKMPTRFNSEMTVYALVIGGWLPLSFRNSNWLVPDRNLVSSIIQIESNNLKGKNKAIKWWLEFIKESDVTISPLLYAFEGNKQKVPTYSEFCTSYEKAVEELSKYFPNGKVISHEDELFYKAGFSILEDMTNKQDDEINFLLEAAPLVATPYSEKQLIKVKEKIDNIARKYKLLGESLLYYLVLSCLYERNDSKYFKAARRVLKPKYTYKQVDAYNTISDVNILNLFIQSWTIFKNPHPICTCDKGLVAFWSGLNPIEVSNSKKKQTLGFL